MDHTECNSRIEYLQNKVFELEGLNENLKGQLEYFQTKFLESNLNSEGSDISSCLTDIYNSLSLDNRNNNSTSSSSLSPSSNNKLNTLKNRNFKINLTNSNSSNNSSSNSSPYLSGSNNSTPNCELNYDNISLEDNSNNISQVQTQTHQPITTSNRPPVAPRSFIRSNSDTFIDKSEIRIQTPPTSPLPTHHSSYNFHNNTSPKALPQIPNQSGGPVQPIFKSNGGTWSTAVVPIAKMRSETIVQSKSPYSPDTKQLDSGSNGTTNNTLGQSTNTDSPSKLYSPRNINSSNSSNSGTTSPTTSSPSVERRPEDRRSKTSPFPTSSTPPLSSSAHLVRTASASGANAVKPQQLSHSCAANMNSYVNTPRPSTPPVGQYTHYSDSNGYNNGNGASPTGQPTNPFEISEDEPEVLDDPKLVMSKTENGSYIVKGGTLEKLVNRLIARHDPDFTSAFLLTHKSFTTSIELLDLLIEFYVNNKDTTIASTTVGTIDLSSSTSSTNSLLSSSIQNSPVINSTESDQGRKKKAIRLKITNVIKSWVDKHYYDFSEDKQLTSKLEQFITNHIMLDMDKIGVNLKRLLVNDRIVPVPTFSNDAPSSIPPKIKNQNSGVAEINFKDLDPTEIARQLTLYESDLFRKIGAKECLNQAWNKDGKEDNAPNIVAFIKRFNQVSSWVATEIVRQEKLKDRVSYIKRFILVAQKCRELNNFNATMEILSGLQNSSVYRLRKTWERVESKPLLKNTYEDLMNLMSSSANYKNYMQELHNIHPPCIPYLGVYLTHLTFIEDGMKNLLTSADSSLHVINFEKCRKISVVIREIKQYQQQQYHLYPEEFTQRYLNNLPSIQSQKSMYKLSLICEPKEKETNSFDSGYGSISDRPSGKKEFSMTSLINSFKS